MEEHMPFLLTGVFAMWLPVNIRTGQGSVERNCFAGGRESDSIFRPVIFSGWNPSDTNFCLKNNGHQYSLYLDSLPPASYLQMHQGSWNTVECKADGHSIDNRLVECLSATPASSSILKVGKTGQFISHGIRQPRRCMLSVIVSFCPNSTGVGCFAYTCLKITRLKNVIPCYMRRAKPVRHRNNGPR